MLKKIILILVLTYSFSSIDVVTTILPLTDFVEKIGGSHVNVITLIPPGANPHSYEPSPKQLQQVSNAKLIVMIGADFQFETIWLPKILKLNKQIQGCNTSEGLEKMDTLEKEAGSTSHHYSNIDPHVWLSIENAISMVTRIQDALILVDPENAEDYLQNSILYITELQSLQEELTQLRRESNQTSFLVFHPAWGYFAKEFDLEQHAFEVEGKEPSPKKLMSIIKEAKKERINTIFIEPQFNQKAAKTIARELGAKVVEMDPLAKDYIQNMRKVAFAVFGEK
ncbi:MAG: hypothetical protein A2Y40_04430 [Candidatus Margulisbacteria bacterium GWF2_35_9]|nr:MAG: hypothetical protein A2Y40_04430 [Candidatus Margulisbacteria bacterium GWF2_35_9]